MSLQKILDRLPSHRRPVPVNRNDPDYVCTVCYDSGIQVSGMFEEVLCDGDGNPIYLRTRGPTQLACGGVEVIGHGVDYHSEGFGSPIGLPRQLDRCLSKYTLEELKAHDIAAGTRVRLEYIAGITVEGTLRHVHRQDRRNLILSFEDCTVAHLDGRILFDPAWGTYDLAVGAEIVSIQDGMADPAKIQLTD